MEKYLLLFLTGLLIIVGSTQQVIATPTSILYLANGDGDSVNRGIYAIDGTDIHRWDNDADVFTIAVQDTINTLVSNDYSYPNITGKQYTLDGVFTGVTYSHPGFFEYGSFHDGATDGEYNYAISNDFGSNLYRFDLNWANPEILFNVGDYGTKLGITYDNTNNSLWVSGFAGSDVIDNWSMDGVLLSSFNTGHNLNAALALDYADQTLWVRDRNSLSALFEQYSKSGELLDTVDFGNLGNTLGGEFAFPTVIDPDPDTPPPVPEPATILLFGLGIIGLAGVSRKKLKK